MLTYSVDKEMGGLESINMESYHAGLDGVLAFLKEIFFLEPSFQCRAILHWEGTVLIYESTYKNAYPWGYYCRDVFEQIIRCLEFQVFWKVEFPCKTLVVISA